MLIELVYCSVATEAVTTDFLLDLLDVARQKNAKLGVTGMLLYSDLTHEFVQLLEGEEDVIEQLISVIAKDERHSSIDVMHRGPIERRSFEKWSMAFRRFEDLDPETLDGCSTFVSGALAGVSRHGKASRAQMVMESLSKSI